MPSPISFQEAEFSFREAQKYVDPERDPAMWNLLKGLTELTQSLSALGDAIQRTKN